MIPSLFHMLFICRLFRKTRLYLLILGIAACKKTVSENLSGFLETAFFIFQLLYLHKNQCFFNMTIYSFFFFQKEAIELLILVISFLKIKSF